MTQKKKQPRKISPDYLRNSGLFYLQRYTASSHHFRVVMQRKINRSIAVHTSLDKEECFKKGNDDETCEHIYYVESKTGDNYCGIRTGMPDKYIPIQPNGNIKKSSLYIKNKKMKELEIGKNIPQSELYILDKYNKTLPNKEVKQLSNYTAYSDYEVNNKPVTEYQQLLGSGVSKLKDKQRKMFEGFKNSSERSEDIPVKDFINDHQIKPLEEKAKMATEANNKSEFRTLRKQVAKRSSELGFFKMTQPKSIGGQPATQLEIIAFQEALSTANVPMLSSSVFGPGAGILGRATGELRERYLMGVLRGELRGSFGFTEPPDVVERTVAVEDGDDLVITGQKSYVTGGDTADFVSAFCNLRKLLIVFSFSNFASGNGGFSFVIYSARVLRKSSLP